MKFPVALVVVLAMATYAVGSRKLGEQYPFSSLSMFSGGLRAAGHVLAVTDDGRSCELTAFRSWTCDHALAFHDCPEGSHDENDRKAQNLIANRSAGGAAPGAGGPARQVQVVRRVFSVASPGGRLTVHDCQLATCTATEVPGQCRRR